MIPKPLSWFIGLPAGPAAWFDELPNPPAPFVRLARADLHLTVAFLGPIEEPYARAGFEAAAAAICGHGPATVTLRDVLPLGPTRDFRALVVDFQAGDEHDLQAQLDPVRAAAWTAARARRDRLTDHLHVTIARRPDGPAANDVLQKATRWALATRVHGCIARFDSVALYVRTPNGPTRYRIVHSSPL